MAQGPSQDQSRYTLKLSLRLAHSALLFEFFYKKNFKKNNEKFIKIYFASKNTAQKKKKKNNICNFSSLKFPIIILPLLEFIFLQHIKAFIFLLINKDKRVNFRLFNLLNINSMQQLDCGN